MSVPEVAELGPSDADVVVLLHGWPAGPHIWRRLAPLLATRFRVVIPTLRDPDLTHQADAVGSLLRERGKERFAVVGHGHGGGVAQLLGLRKPAPAALVLLDPIAFDVGPPASRDVDDLIERGSVEFADLPQTDRDAYVAFGTSTPPPAALDLTPFVPSMASWDFPVFLLWGEDDPFVPVEIAERLGDALPGSTLGLVPQSGHHLLDDAFDTVGVMIHEYLRARYQGAPHGHEGVVMLQLERRPAWVDLAPYMEEEGDPTAPGPGQEVGPLA